ncbi:MAG TPA: exodeoxyribonuclease III [Gemmatimonadales bacterium]
MKIATWNVNGIRARAAQLSEWMQRDRPDIVCLQELKATAAQIPAECRVADYHVYWHPLKGYSGVSIHVRKDLFAVDPVFTHPPFDMESRIVQVEHGDLVIASIYVPNGGKDYAAKLAFVKSLIEWSGRLAAEGRQLIVCGDLNIARADMDVHPKERKPNAVGQRPEERALFQSLLDTRLVDMSRQFEPDNDNLFTWWAPWRNLRARNIGWRLDYFLASPALASRATGCIVQSDVGTSDHAPVMLSLAP